MRVKAFLEKHYQKFPVVLQNILVSAQGYVFKRARFSRYFQQCLVESSIRTSWSADDLERYQFDRAQLFLKYAYENSPFWREQFNSVNFSWQQFQDISDIRKLPILEKDILREHAKKIKSSELPDCELVTVQTSGTSGKPLTVFASKRDGQERQAILFRLFDVFGVKPFDRSVRFSGRMLFPKADKNFKFWRYNAPMRQLLMSSYHLRPDFLDAYVKKLTDFQPKLIDGYPSSIYVLAKYINDSGLSSHIKPRLVVTTAETLEDFQRLEITKAFGHCPVINQYASSEGAPFITENEFGEMVVNIDTGIFEFVKPGTDIPAERGEIAEMLVTSFTTHGTPLIRYRIGDSVELMDDVCLSKSWAMPKVRRVVGRQEDILYTKERGFIPSLNKVFSTAPKSIKEAQIVQVSLDLIELRIVLDSSQEFHEDDLEGPIRELLSRVGNVDIKVEIKKNLERGPNGKLRAVVGSPEVMKMARFNRL